ncbi:MAG: Cof-type HAD-IIB family hydrolase [Lachnospiraceae bacterium]|nr:Cof-type HAD-IIB family hydrolase [Lachnospiraceae bacterium]
MKTIRLLAVDMDGTLLSPDGTVSRANADAIRSIQQAGVRVAVCTGRSFHDASLPVKAAGLVCDFICMNGAACYGKDGKQTGKITIPVGKQRRILELAEEFGLATDLMGEDCSYTTQTREAFRESYEAGILLPMAELDFASVEERFTFLSRQELEARGVDIYKISVMHRSSELLGEVRAVLEAEGGLALAASHETNLEITSSFAQKGRALVEYAKKNQIELHEIMAIGDSGNDVSMLSLPLGFSVSMGNAMEEAKRAARFETKTNAQDGVAWALEELLHLDQFVLSVS